MLNDGMSLEQVRGAGCLPPATRPPMICSHRLQAAVQCQARCILDVEQALV
jgi:hypothetical protein